VASASTTFTGPTTLRRNLRAIRKNSGKNDGNDEGEAT